MSAPPPYRRPTSPPDLEAQIWYLATGEGGKQRAVASGYRPNHNFGLPQGLNDAQHEYPGREWVHPGETVSALLWLLAPEMQRKRLHVGFEFTVQEAFKVVGLGKVTRVLNQDLQRDA